VGGFARLYDLISSEYGWTDEQISEISVARARQILATIELRIKASFAQRASLTEWSTKRIVEFIAATVPTQQGKTNKLLDYAQKVSLGLFKEDSQKEEEEVPPEVFIEKGSQKAENSPGSFEGLIRGLS